jgi:hypothetical protein
LGRLCLAPSKIKNCVKNASFYSKTDIRQFIFYHIQFNPFL